MSPSATTVQVMADALTTLRAGVAAGSSTPFPTCQPLPFAGAKLELEANPNGSATAITPSSLAPASWCESSTSSIANSTKVFSPFGPGGPTGPSKDLEGPSVVAAPDGEYEDPASDYLDDNIEAMEHAFMLCGVHEIGVEQACVIPGHTGRGYVAADGLLYHCDCDPSGLLGLKAPDLFASIEHGRTMRLGAASTLRAVWWTRIGYSIGVVALDVPQVVDLGPRAPASQAGLLGLAELIAARRYMTAAAIREGRTDHREPPEYVEYSPDFMAAWCRKWHRMDKRNAAAVRHKLVNQGYVARQDVEGEGQTKGRYKLTEKALTLGGSS